MDGFRYPKVLCERTHIALMPGSPIALHVRVRGNADAFLAKAIGCRFEMGYVVLPMNGMLLAAKT